MKHSKPLRTGAGLLTFFGLILVCRFVAETLMRSILELQEEYAKGAQFKRLF